MMPDDGTGKLETSKLPARLASSLASKHHAKRRFETHLSLPFLAKGGVDHRDPSSGTGLVLSRTTLVSIDQLR